MQSLMDWCNGNKRDFTMSGVVKPFPSSNCSSDKFVESTLGHRAALDASSLRSPSCACRTGEKRSKKEDMNGML